MKRGLIVILFLVLLLFPILSASEADSAIQKLTHYAEEYETGNINYVQLLIYISSSREKLNEMLGATGKEFGGVVKQEEIGKILGEPVEETKWVWVEGEERDAKLDYSVPVWKKIVFDGKKIRIGLEAFPSIFKKKAFKDEFESTEIQDGDLIYRLNFNIEFKKPQEQFDFQSKIDSIKSLAESFNADPSDSKAEALAKESVNAERIFESYFRNNQGKCEDLMSSVFGSENKRQNQQMLLNEIDFFEGDNFEAIVRLEMCDNCEWNWINFDMRIEGRGPGFKMPKQEGGESMNSFKNLDDSLFKSKTIELISEMRSSLEQGDYSSAMSSSNSLRMLTEAWNEKANNVWPELDKQFQDEEKSMTEQERFELNQNYGWIKREQQKRQRVKELQKANYDVRKEFYLSLFSDYEKREYYFTQTEFEKRLVEEFKEFGREICDNNKDDNENEQTDCEEAQCGGKICGKGTAAITENNETKETEVNFYCIQGTCQAKEEIIKIKKTICGNHICEEGESIENCAEDCSLCTIFEAIECSGKVIFKGKDENGCPLNPICIEGEEFCQTTADCFQPLCGIAECIRFEPEDEKGKCKITELKECEEAQCVEGQNKIMKCNLGEEIIAETCIEGLWKTTGATCKGGTSEEEVVGEVVEEDIVGEECSVKEDCGGENDVCSNGKCITLPEVVHVEQEIETGGQEQPETPEEQPEVEEQGEVPSEPETPSEPESEPQTEEQSEEQPEAPLTEAILPFLRNLFVKGIIGMVTAQEEGETPEIVEEEPEQPITCPEPGEPPQVEDNCQYETVNDENGCISGYKVECDEKKESHNEGEQGEFKGDDFKGDREEGPRCNDECERICYDTEVRPCVEPCIREACGESMDCDIDAETKTCEASCKAEKDISSCKTNCVEKCKQGGDWWQEFEKQPNEEMNKQEKGVFNVGGGCRTSQGKTDGFIWFGGWGDPFEQIQPLKQKYYSGGEADWCKYEIENKIKQRQEFEKGFNEDFAQWFFETHLANSAEDWEQSVSGIFELYWSNVDNQMQMAHMLNCLETNSIEDVMDYNLINIKYNTEYGSLEYWEEIKEIKMPGMKEKVTIISPYMKVWIFPPKSFIKYELKQAMENHEFPGKPEEKTERKNEEGLTQEEKLKIREDKRFMKKITDISEKYGGSADIAVQFDEDDEVIFNLYVQVNEQDIINIEPMLPSEMSEIDITIKIPFSELYDMIYFMEKDMRGEETESPPWDKRPRAGIIKGVVDGVKMSLKIKSLMSSAKVSPESSASDAKALFKEFFKMMQEGDKGMSMEQQEEEDKGEEKDMWESKGVITGEVISEDNLFS